MTDAPRSLFSRRLSRGELIALDAVAAAGYLLVMLPQAAASPAAGGGLPAWARAAIVAAAGLPLAVRRLWPLPVFAVVLAASTAALLLGVAADPYVAAAYALYPVALTARPRGRAPTAVGVAGGVLLLLLATMGAPAPAPVAAAVPFLLGAALLGVAWTAGRAVRERREYAARSAARLAADAVLAERLRIAREMHDVVAHGLGLIAVKAAVANHVLRERPEEAHDALRVIEATSREALAELRRMLGALRAGGEAPEPDLGPAPGPDALPELARRAAAAGVRVELDAAELGPLPEGVGLTVYRIVQEALTNVVRHAAPAHCRVTVRDAGGEVRIEVVDDGPGTRVLPAGPGAGHGLVGMRERAALYGGAFEAGPRPEGGFRVAARLPYRPEAER